MKKIPRTCGLRWPAIVFISMLLLIPLMIGIHSAGAAGIEAPNIDKAVDDLESAETSGAETEEAVTSVAETEGPVSINLSGAEGELTSDQTVAELSVGEPEPVYEWNFQKQTEFDVVDRENDEGGALSILFAPSPSDSPDYVYWAYESGTSLPGSWQQFGAIASDSSYYWEKPQTYGFFLSPNKHGRNMHYIEFEHSYPATGIYSQEITTETDEEGNLTENVIINVMIYDEAVDDYSTLEVFCNLAKIGGGRVQLVYQEPEPGSSPAPWDNLFTGISTWTPEKVSITKPTWLPISAPVRGKSTVMLETQAMEVEGVRTITGSGGEPNVPDNRDPHYFMLYAVPTGYTLPEGQEFPPDEWLIGSTAEPVVAHKNIWNSSRTNEFVWAVLICCAVMGYIILARKGTSLFLRRIAGLDHVEEAIGRATEMGRPILYTTGLGYVSDIASIASINILGQVARKVAAYESRLINPHHDPILMAVCQEVVQEAYIDAGHPDAFNKDDIFFITDDQFAYAAAVNGIMVREKPATILLMGLFYAESLLLAETGNATGAIQIAGTDALAQLPFFITACDYTLIGEELYAASAYLSREPLLVGSLKGQDLSKMILMALTFLGTLAICGGIEFIQQLFQAF
jgi:hypothetical protein